MAILTTLAEVLAPQRCALLVIDVQRDFVHPDGWSARRDPRAAALRDVVPVINALVRGARRAAVPVVYVTMEHGPEVDAPNYRARYARRDMTDEILCARGSWGAALDDTLLPPEPGDLRVVRHTYDAFARTSLHDLLQARGVETVVGTGVVTDLCVRTTLEHAFALGYYVVAVADATAAVPPEAARAALDHLARFVGEVVPAATVLELWSREA